MKKNSFTAMILAFLLPGAGHFYLGKHRRAIVFALIVILMFVVGLVIDGKIYVSKGGNILTLLATLGSMGSGILYLLARLTGPYGDIGSITYEYGTAFTLTAGLMNLLLVLDAYDIAEEEEALMLESHVVLMFFYAVLTGVFFSLLWKEEKKERIRFFFVVFASLFVGGIALAWLMYPFPLK